MSYNTQIGPRAGPATNLNMSQVSAQTNTQAGSNGSFGVFVGDLAPHINEDHLRQFFAQVGFVANVKVIRDPATQRSKKYGFVHFNNEMSRQRAIEQLNGAAVQGHPIQVRAQHYKESDKCLVKPGTKPTDLYVGNIPRGVTKQQVLSETQAWQIPPVAEVRVHQNEAGCFCFITFHNDQDALTTLNILSDASNPRSLAGRTVMINTTPPKNNNHGRPAPRQFQNPHQRGPPSQHFNHPPHQQRQQRTNYSRNSALYLQNPHMAQTPEEQQILRNLEQLKTMLGGEMCTFTDGQIALLEKSQRTLYVRNLTPDASQEQMRERFASYGTIKSVVIVPDKETGIPIGYGFVEFYSSSSSATAASQSPDHECSVSRPPKDILAMLQPLGLTDAKGQFIGQLTTALSVPQQAYFQDPKTGQLFLGDAQHAAHYVSQGYVQVQVPTQQPVQQNYYYPGQAQQQPQQQQQQQQVQQPAANNSRGYGQQSAPGRTQFSPY